MAKLLKKFVQSLQACPSDLQAKAIAIIRDLSADPLNAASRHSIAPDSRALSPDVYKVRLNDSYRLVLQRVTIPKLEWVPIYTGRHEAVDRFVVRYQPIVDAEDRITILPPNLGPAQEKKVPLRYTLHETGLFDAWADADLIRLGVPIEGLAEVRSAKRDEDLDRLSGLLSEDVLNSLIDWLTAPSERERTAILGLIAGTHKTVEPADLSQFLARPENYEEVVELGEPEELAELLEKAPLEDWMIYLHPDQRAIVDRDFSGPARIRGVSGSGKTVILAHRAKRLARAICKGENDRILVLTHNRVLAGLLNDRLLPKLCGPELYHIEVNTIHGWASQYVEGPRVKFEDAERCLREAILAVKKDMPGSRILDRPVAFFQEEISQVIRGRLLSDLEAYTELQRRGRGSPLTAEQRNSVWKVFEEYVRIRGKSRVLDSDDLLQGALYKLVGPEGSNLAAGWDTGWALRLGPTGHNYKAVLVDETQDLTELGLRMVYAIAGDGSNGLFLVGDGLQKIYKGGFSLRRLGIEIAGRSLVLKKNFRNTRAIMAPAYALVSDMEFEEFDDEAKTKTVPPELSARIGEKPVICKCSSLEGEAYWVGETICDLRTRLGMRLSDIAVLYRGGLYKNAVDEALRRREIGMVFHVENDFLSSEEAVRVSTIHSTKGMEFRAVFVVGLTEKVFPWAGIDQQNSTVEEKRAHVELQQRLLYVAMTRARDYLFLTYPMRDKNGNSLKPSRFLSRIEPFCEVVDATRVIATAGSVAQS